MKYLLFLTALLAGPALAQDTSPAQLIAGYEAAGGRHVDPAELKYWETFGSLRWGVTLLGYLLGNVKFIGDNIDAVLLVIVGVSLLPMIFEWWMERRKTAKESAEA